MYIHCQPNVDLVNDDVYSKFVSISIFVLKILNKNRILTSIKGCNAVAKLRKIMFYNPKVDLVNDNVYTQFCLSSSICSQDIENN